MFLCAKRGMNLLWLNDDSRMRDGGGGAAGKPVSGLNRRSRIDWHERRTIVRGLAEDGCILTQGDEEGLPGRDGGAGLQRPNGRRRVRLGP